MTQIERQRGGQRKQAGIGSLLTIVLVLLLFLARNYLASDSNAAATDTTVAQTSEVSTNGNASGGETQAEPAQGDVEIVIENDASNEPQKGDSPSSAAVGSAVEKKATRTPTPKPRNTSTPTRMAKATATRTPTAKRAPPTATQTPRAAQSQSGLPVIYFEDLPRQAQETIQLIDRGGPFPFSRDGIEFQNRERLLPRKPRGYYSEYTVITPGSNDRGARRIIAGENGELYYTDDHYDSFKEVVR